MAGHYVGGITGLENGTAPPPGFFGTFLPYVNHITSIKGPAGHTVLTLDFNLTAYNNVFAMTTEKKFLGDLKREAKGLSNEFKQLYDECMKA